MTANMNFFMYKCVINNIKNCTCKLLLNMPTAMFLIHSTVNYIWTTDLCGQLPIAKLFDISQYFVRAAGIRRTDQGQAR